MTEWDYVEKKLLILKGIKKFQKRNKIKAGDEVRTQNPKRKDLYKYVPNQETWAQSDLKVLQRCVEKDMLVRYPGDEPGHGSSLGSHKRKLGEDPNRIHNNDRFDIGEVGKIYLYYYNRTYCPDRHVATMFDIQKEFRNLWLENKKKGLLRRKK